ncbi:expressed unknown protein [Seminavis robusta]|uniref:Uncharacterized protein n=1 Tax=Seminavis robusta TaxID=568900 RepID=A0A9N8E3J4_9STRA|nr:expressed unknown protein [Seminavis robusta]|eukprot:Sro488_g153190.1 n/a (297) ;mRNA; r:62175-63065
MALEDVVVVNNNSAAGSATSRKRKLPDVDPTMELTAQEKQWALDIKEAFADDDEICAKVFSDMQIAIFAIVDRDDVGRSLERAQCLQAFRMQYNINDAVQEGIDIFRRQQDICPGMLLSIEECPNDDGRGSHALVMDLAKYFPLRFLDNPKDFRCSIGSIYYSILCTQPDLTSVRDGFRQVFECDDVGWENACFKAELKSVDELLTSLPYRRKQVKCLRMPSVLLVVLHLLRPFMPKEEYDAFSYGSEDLQIEFPDRIDQFYMQPNADQAFEHLMKRCTSLLKRRVENEESFRLQD